MGELLNPRPAALKSIHRDHFFPSSGARCHFSRRPAVGRSPPDPVNFRRLLPWSFEELVSYRVRSYPSFALFAIRAADIVPYLSTFVDG